MRIHGELESGQLSPEEDARMALLVDNGRTSLARQGHERRRVRHRAGPKQRYRFIPKERSEPLGQLTVGGSREHRRAKGEACSIVLEGSDEPRPDVVGRTQ